MEHWKRRLAAAVREGHYVIRPELIAEALLRGATPPRAGQPSPPAPQARLN